MTVGQVLEIYAEDHAPTTVAPERIGYAVAALWPFWHALTVSAVKGATCRRYEAERGVSPSTVRRELGALQAALKYCATEGHLLTAPEVWKPTGAPPKDRWLTRREVAVMLRASRRLRKDGRHLAKFILAGRYTGTRKAAVLALRIDQPSTDAGYIDTERGVLHRIGSGERRTKKRRGSAKLPRQFLAHVRRWKANGCRFVVEDYTGARVGDIKNGWRNMLRIAVKIAEKDEWTFDPEGVTPHVLRHTAITHAMQRGARPADVSSFFDVSMATLERVYWHHHPDHQESAVRAMEDRA